MMIIGGLGRTDLLVISHPYLRMQPTLEGEKLKAHVDVESVGHS